MSDDHKAVYDALHQAQTANDPVALATIVSTQGSIPRHAGSKMLVREDGSIVGTVGGGTLESLVIEEGLASLIDGQTRLKSYTLNKLDEDPGVCGGTAQIFIEPIALAPTLVVVGAGHVGKAVAELGKWLGFRIVVCDDRAELCDETVLPNMDEYVICPPGEMTQHIKINTQTYIVAVTRGVNVDTELLPPLLETNTPYIGVIGSRRRWSLTAQTLKDNGIMDEQLARVRSPIGLELEAETPKEIAVSIIAEIIMLRRGAKPPAN
jgi:xanthine dehydrogenase accessory factor